MNLFDFFSFSSLAHSEIAENGADKVLSSGKENSSVHKTYVNFPTSRKSALDVPLYAISILFSFFCRGLQMRRNFLTTCTISGTRGEKLQTDAALCGRIAENGADAKPCLSDVYKSGTRARRRQVDAALCGRSMVEMLGVLAIIGVLSVGAISGYSKAMMKYKLNKQAEQISTILNNAMLYVGEFNTTSGSIITPLVKLGAIPEDMVRGTDSNPYLNDVFNNRLNVNYHIDGSVTFYGISYTIDNSSYNLEICRNIITAVKENAADLWHINMYKSASGGEVNIEGRTYGDRYCNPANSNTPCLRNMDVTKIDGFCRYCQQKTCYLGILFGYNG